MDDTVEYIVAIRHHQDGEVEISIQGVGDSESDRKSIAYALEQAINLVLNGNIAIFH